MRTFENSWSSDYIQILSVIVKYLVRIEIIQGFQNQNQFFTLHLQRIQESPDTTVRTLFQLLLLARISASVTLEGSQNVFKYATVHDLKEFLFCKSYQDPGD